MTRRAVLLAVSLCVAGCAPKKAEQGGMMTNVKLVDRQAVVGQVNAALRDQAGFTAMPCLTPSRTKGVTKQCFGFSGDPEKYLPTLSEHLGQLGQKTMQWRQDFGLWASQYAIVGDRPYTMVLILTAKGLDPDLDAEPKLKGFDGYAWYTLGID